MVGREYLSFQLVPSAPEGYERRDRSRARLHNTYFVDQRHVLA